MKNIYLIVILIGLFALGGCGQAGSGATGVIEGYLTALVEEDTVQAVSLSCAAWEESALAEGAAFAGVEVELVDPACSLVEESDDQAVVACAGSFQFTYAGGEQQELDLSNRQYLLKLEAGEWKMCGYK